MKITINFDMDGTIADLYGVENWLDYLINKNTIPYTQAKPLINLSVLARYLNKLQKMGYAINIVSWLAKVKDYEYGQKVTEVKIKWLQKHLKSVHFDNIYIVPYGTPKSTFKIQDTDILFDDEENNRDDWGMNGFNETEIFTVLKQLIKSA